MQLGYLGLRIVLKKGKSGQSEGSYVWFGYVAVIAAVGFGLFVTNLAVFHSYLVLKNVTTWEYLSWNKISYL